MKYYNIYYKGVKINNRPITDAEVNDIKGNEVIYKKNQITNQIEPIQTKKIKYVKTIVL